MSNSPTWITQAAEAGLPVRGETSGRSTQVVSYTNSAGNYIFVTDPEQGVKGIVHVSWRSAAGVISYVQTLNWTGTTYGPYLAGPTADNFQGFGWSLDIADSGKLLAIGAPGYKASNNASRTGKVFIFESDGIGGAFSHITDYLNGTGTLGDALCFNHNQGDPTYLFMCDRYKVHCVVVTINDADDYTTWTNTKIDKNSGLDADGVNWGGGEAADQWGTSCCCSDDGKVVGIGAYKRGDFDDGALTIFESISTIPWSGTDLVFNGDDAAELRRTVITCMSDGGTNHILSTLLGLSTNVVKNSKWGQSVSTLKQKPNPSSVSFIVSGPAHSNNARNGINVHLTYNYTHTISNVFHITGNTETDGSYGEQRAWVNVLDSETFLITADKTGQSYLYELDSATNPTAIVRCQDSGGVDIPSVASFMTNYLTYHPTNTFIRNTTVNSAGEVFMIFPTADNYEYATMGSAFYNKTLVLGSSLYSKPLTSNETLSAAHGSAASIGTYITALDSMASDITPTAITSLFESSLSASKSEIGGTVSEMKSLLKMMARSMLSQSSYSTISVSKDTMEQFFPDLPDSVHDEIAIVTAGETSVVDLDTESVYAPLEADEYIIIEFTCEGILLTINVAKDSTSTYTVTINDEAYDISGSDQEGDTATIYYTTSCNYTFTLLFGSVVLGGEGTATAGGDPYVTPLYGLQYKLPDRESCYRMFERGNVFINSSVKQVDAHKKQAILDYAQSVYNSSASTLDVTESAKLLSVDNLVLDGYFFDSFLIYSEQHVMLIDLKNKQFKTQKESEGYFNIEHKKIKEIGFGNTGLYKDSARTKVTISWTHSEFGKMCSRISAYDNPQIDNGLTITKSMTTKDCVGLLMHNFKPKFMEIPTLNTLGCKKLHRRLNNSKNKYINKRILSKNETLVSIGKSTVKNAKAM